MKKNKFLTSLVLVGFIGSSYANTAVISNTTIDSIDVGVSGELIGRVPGIDTNELYIDIQADGDEVCQGTSCDSVGIDKPCIGEYKLLMTDHTYFAELYSMILSAQLSQQPLNLTFEKIYGVGEQFQDVTYCKITSVKLIAK